MKWVSVIRAAVLAACVLLIPVLWKYWGSICNESCEVGRAMTLQALSVAFPVSLFLTTLAWTARASTNLLRYASLGLAVVLFLLGIYFSFAK
jgi:hypothetical protein